MVYAVPDGGIAAAGNTSEKAPLLPTVPFCVVPLIVTDTVSPLGGYTGPAAEIVPDRVIEVVPAKIACEAVRPLKAGVSACTVMVAMVRYCSLFAVTVAALV